ncbi:MAG: lytic transglycosylase domain-containing protein [Endomicrobiaceae bacterium]|nr:lytic transglycosylase domain-containing protein [Endomicrobiaceae bacterium]
MNIKKYKLLLILSGIFLIGFLYIFVHINNTWKYSEFINKYAAQYNVDPILIKAIIKAESNFVSNAVSNKGAIGLMQIMPATGKQIAQYLQVKDFKEEMLFNPEINIMFGVCYYKILDTMFNGNSNLILASYNAGLGNVTQWRQMNPIVEYDSEQMPFNETKKYVKKIDKIYAMLKFIDKIKKLIFFGQ